METQRDQELIQKYVDRSASPEEVKEIEKRIATEPEFRKMHEEYKRLPAGIRYHFLKQRLDQLKTLEKALPPHDEVFLIGRYANWRIIPAMAAAVAIIIITVLLFRGDSNSELYAKNFEPYPNVFEPTQRGDDATDRRASAFSMYEQRNYEGAAALFAELLSEKKEPEILLLLGNANMVLDRNEEAKNNFLTLIRDFDGLDEQAKWFLSLCYLKSGDREKAKLIWEELGDPKVTYSDKAKRLLEEVK
jgi:hypothetical protein